MAERRAFRAVRDRDLSLWQSAAASVVRQRRGTAESPDPAYAHELVQTATAQAVAKSSIPATASQARQSDRAWATRKMAAAPDSAKLSNLAFQYAMARREHRTADADKLENELRKYGDGGTQWIACAEEYLAYYVLADGQPAYREPSGPDFGLINHQLPLNATIALLGDWGTGMDDARQLLYSVLDRHKPDAIIHLGDVYYSCTSSRDGKRGECQSNFIEVVDDAFAKVGKRVPVFAIPGNHDYYSGGSGYFEIIDSINAPSNYPGADASWAQQASFFCLRSADRQWQFLGMDTGVSDRNPMSQVTAPMLRERESEWLQQRVREFPGTTILLSHHQLFSGNEQLNDKGRKYINEALLDTFAPYFDKVAAWFWGHEHNFVLFENGLLGLAKGRLLGSSAYEESTEANPYELKAAAEGIRYLDKERYRLDRSSGYFNHSYAVLELRGDSIEASYYQFPSWGDTPPPVAAESLIFKEKLSVSSGSVAPGPLKSITSGAVVRLETPNGRCIGDAYSGLRYYYPTLGNKPRAIGLQVAKAGGAGGNLRHGDQITLRATQKALGDKNVLSAFKKVSELYYYSAGYAQNETWILQRADGPGELRSGDAVAFTNVRFAGQYLRPHPKAKYLTCDGRSSFFWRVIEE